MFYIRLKLRAYKLQLLQKIISRDRDWREQPASRNASSITKDGTYINRFFFPDTFHVCGTASMHNFHVWGSENQSEATEHERHSPKVNVWFPVVKNIISLLFLEEPRTAAEKFLAVMEYTATRHTPAGSLPVMRFFQLLCLLGLYSYALLVVHDFAQYLRVSKCKGPKFHLHHQFKETEFLFPSDVVGTNFGPSVFYSTEDVRVLRTEC